jgi:hypothetical protein
LGGPTTDIATVDSSTAAAMEATAAACAGPTAAGTSATTLGIEFTGSREWYQTGQKYLGDVSHDVTLLMLEEEVTPPNLPLARGGDNVTWLLERPGGSS